MLSHQDNKSWKSYRVFKHRLQIAARNRSYRDLYNIKVNFLKLAIEKKIQIKLSDVRNVLNSNTKKYNGSAINFTSQNLAYFAFEPQAQWVIFFILFPLPILRYLLLYYVYHDSFTIASGSYLEPLFKTPAWLSTFIFLINF